MINVAVIYYSETGSIKGLAEAAAEGATKAGADVRLLSAEAARNDDMEWADVVLFGTPSHYGTIAAGLKTYIDSTGDLWRAGRLADKVYGAFVSSASTHGGQETALTNFATIFSHWGGIIVPPGFTAPVAAVEQMQSGNPHGAGHVAGFGNPPTEFALEAARYQAGRAVKVATQLTSDVTATR
jgi:NAD(P)H dehydrogenase (quinone)